MKKPRTTLTPRQAEVMDALIRLGDRKLVARELQIERNTVDGILRNAVARLGVRNRLQAVVKASALTAPPAPAVPAIVRGLSQAELFDRTFAAG